VQLFRVSLIVGESTSHLHPCLRIFMGTVSADPFAWNVCRPAKILKSRVGQANFK
jgi:hypothetical protein